MTTPPADLPSLATPDDIVARLGRNMNSSEAARVDAMLQDGSAIIRRFAREDFVIVSQDVVKLLADAGVINIPNIPVISIDGLLALSGMAGVPNMTVTWYRFDGVSQILVPEPSLSGIINLPAFWYESVWSRQSFQLTYTHGYASTPAEVKGLLCSAIISELSTPTMSATVQSESIGAYSYSMRRSYSRGSAGSSGAMAGIHAALIDFGMMQVLADYRQSQGTIALRF
jgi:hypothetical protein